MFGIFGDSHRRNLRASLAGGGGMQFVTILMDLLMILVRIPAQPGAAKCTCTTRGPKLAAWSG